MQIHTTNNVNENGRSSSAVKHDLASILLIRYCIAAQLGVGPVDTTTLAADTARYGSLFLNPCPVCKITTGNICLWNGHV